MARKSIWKELPIELKIISILAYVAAVFMIILGVLFAFSIFRENELVNGTIGVILFLGGGIFLGFAVYYLQKGKNWARSTMIFLFAALAILSFVVFDRIYSGISPSNDRGVMILSFVGLVFCIAFFLYLLANKKIKEMFS